MWGITEIAGIVLYDIQTDPVISGDTQTEHLIGTRQAEPDCMRIAYRTQIRSAVPFVNEMYFSRILFKVLSQDNSHYIVPEYIISCIFGFFVSCRSGCLVRT